MRALPTRLRVGQSTTPSNPIRGPHFGTARAGPPDSGPDSPRIRRRQGMLRQNRGSLPQCPILHSQCECREKEKLSVSVQSPGNLRETYAGRLNSTQGPNVHWPSKGTPGGILSVHLDEHTELRGRPRTSSSQPLFSLPWGPVPLRDPTLLFNLRRVLLGAVTEIDGQGPTSWLRPSHTAGSRDQLPGCIHLTLLGAPAPPTPGLQSKARRQRHPGSPGEGPVAPTEQGIYTTQIRGRHGGYHYLSP